MQQDARIYQDLDRILVTKEEIAKKIAELGRKITDNVKTKIKGVRSTDPEYWGLREVLTEEEVDIGLTMKLRKWYTFEELFKKIAEYSIMNDYRFNQKETVKKEIK